MPIRDLGRRATASDDRSVQLIDGDRDCLANAIRGCFGTVGNFWGFNGATQTGDAYLPDLRASLRLSRRDFVALPA